MRYSLIPVLIFLAIGSAGAEEGSSVDSLKSDTLLFQPGALLIENVPATDTANLERRLYQNPTGALFKSMVVPGWGQFGNHKYIKAGLFAALDAWMIASAVHYGSQASDYFDRYEQATDVSTRNELYDLYRDRQDERNKFTWFAVIVTFVSMFDAYVDAHLSGYPSADRAEGVSFDLTPQENGGAQLVLSCSF